MNNVSTVFDSTPTEITLTLCWIDDFLKRDSAVARAALECDFSAELIKLHRMVEQGAFEEAGFAVLDAILEKFALIQAIAFARRGKP